MTELADQTRSTEASAAGQVRDDFVPKEPYVDPRYVALEKERLWPKVWQVVCRLEELPNPGDYVTYEVADESIVVVRVDDQTLRAYYNVCQHRGRRLTEGCGNAKHFYCRFHGWRWNLDGSSREVVCPEDYAGCLQDSEIGLKSVHVDTWAGFVFITMEDAPQPLRDFLAPVPEILDGFEFEKMRYRWYKTVVLPCNWKVVLGAFNEGYHVTATHPQLLRFYDERTVSEVFGPHSMVTYHPDIRPFGLPSPRLVPDSELRDTDPRKGLVGFVELMERQLHALYTPRDAEATKRLLAEVSEDEDPNIIFMKMMMFQRDAAIAEGAGWPDGLTPENILRAGADWHMFPNFIVLPYLDAALCYRARPNGDHPDSCVFDVWSLVRYAPGAEPALKREFFSEWREEDDWGGILSQDFQNLGEVQKGMKSRGFVGSRTNPVQERGITNFHRALSEYYLGIAGDATGKAGTR